MDTPLFEIAGLCIDFRTRDGVVRAVNDVSFTLGTREILGIVGESGSGKTITMLASVGLINDPNVVVSGSIRYKGQELLGLPPRALRQIRGRDIAIIFQDPMTAMTPVHSVGWQIVEQLRAHLDLSRKAARSRAIELLDLMGIADAHRQFDRYPHQLSGGMRQRAMIAMALSCNPSMLIADEPTTALDVTVQAQILALLDRLRHEFGSSIIVITHDMGVVGELADRVMVMYGGRVVETAQKAVLLATPGHPYTRGLLAAIPPMDGSRPHRLMAIPGTPPSPANMPPGCAFAPRCAERYAPCDIAPHLPRQGQHKVACHRVDAAA